MSLPEGLVWLGSPVFANATAIPVPGLSSTFPNVYCTDARVCLVTTGMGKSNAAASMSALLFGGALDLSAAYILISGIAGVDPAQGTVGGAFWARYVVDFGLQWELDARERDPAWTTGYLGINTQGPDAKPSLTYGTELYTLNETLLQRAMGLSNATVLADSPDAQQYRAKYPFAPANSPPTVRICDSLTSDVWWGGTLLGQRARDWVRLLTDGLEHPGVYCAAQQEDNASLEAIARAAKAGKADWSRVAVLRAGSDFDRPPPNTTSAANLLGYAAQGGLFIALQNLVAVASPVIVALLADQ